MKGPVLGRQRLSKLRAMTAAEIAERLRYRAAVALERRQHTRGRLSRPERLESALSPSMRGGNWQEALLSSRRANRSRFLPAVRNREAMRSLFMTQYAPEHTRTREAAADARAGRFDFFGQTFSFPGAIPWQADPVTGRPWPPVFHADVPVHAGDIGCGDVKYVWELSRQQYLIDLAKSVFIDGDPASLCAIRSLVRSWIAGNPYATGVNWSCALEPAFRCMSWLWAYFLTVSDLDDEFHLEWLCSFYEHARFIERHLERYSSPFNHLIGEAAALYMLGACFPEFQDAARWRASGREILEGRLAQQFYADGGSVEQSTFYHHATVGYYVLAALTARATGDELSARIWRAIELGIEFSMTLVQPDGRIPEIGGADDGKPIRMEHLPFWDFRPYQAIGAVIFERGDFKTVAGRFHEDALWLLGPEGLRKFQAMDAMAPGAPSRALESSGYYILRSDWSERADYVCFDCGEQAAGMRADAVPNSMHGHADCLSVVVWLGGRRVLVDSGFYAYNCGGTWEAHFRETAAHNTARVDGRDQALHIGKMAWSHSYRATRERWTADGRQAWVVGSHDGFARGANGVTHRRAVWLRPGGYLVILDEFIGSGDHDLEVNFQFAPGELDSIHTHGLTYQAGVDMVWAGSAAWTPEVSNGGAEPHDGWIAPSLGVRQAAPRLTLRCRTSAARSTLVSVLATRTATASRLSIVTGRGHEVNGCLIAVGGERETDWIAAAGLSAGTPLDTDALLAICRLRDGTVAGNERIGGTRFTIDAHELERLVPTGVPR